MTAEAPAGPDAREAEAAASGPSITEVIRRSAAYLERHGVESPRANVEALLMRLLGTDRAGLYVRLGGLDTATAKALGRALCRRCTGTPLQHLTGEQAFLGLTLRVEPGVFVPRPETEALVLAALDALSGREDVIVIDAGTGTGAIALAVKLDRPDARVLGTDVNPQAVDLARRNGSDLGLSVEFFEGDLLDPVPTDLRGRLDALVSNPPYLRGLDALPAEVLADPHDALVGGTRIHARLALAATVWLRPGGWLLVEIGDEQGGEVRALFEGSGLQEVENLPDLTGRDRIVVGRRGS
jgi:release factor glutamine methyltransferase